MAVECRVLQREEREGNEKKYVVKLLGNGTVGSCVVEDNERRGDHVKSRQHIKICLSCSLQSFFRYEPKDRKGKEHLRKINCEGCDEECKIREALINAQGREVNVISNLKLRMQLAIGMDR